MRKLSILAVLFLGMASNAWAWNCPQTVSATTNFACTQTVFNDSGSALTSGTVVIWDNDDTEFDRTGYPYVTTTTTADHDWVAGVTVANSCADQTFCDIVVWGPARTQIADTTDDASEDTTVATSSVAGMAGDWGGAGNTCYLGLLMENYNLDTEATTATQEDGVSMMVFVNPGCED